MWQAPEFFWEGKEPKPVAYDYKIQCEGSDTLLEGTIDDPEEVARKSLDGRLDVDWKDQNGTRVARVWHAGSAASTFECSQGALVTASLWARNRLYASDIVDITFNATFTPSTVVGLDSRENTEGKFIEVDWTAPSDTGLGDDSAPILAYKIEWSICRDFGQARICNVQTRELLGHFTAKIMSFNITQEELQQGERYFIRVSASNSVGYGPFQHVIQRYRIKPQILQPAVGRLEVASEETFAHIWLGAANPRLDGLLPVKIAGLGMETSDHLKISLHFDEDQLITGQGNISFSAFNKMPVTDEISFIMSLPQKRCPRFECTGRILFENHDETASVVLRVRYFIYPQPAFLSLLPSGGPEKGGTSVVLQIRDYVGKMTRYAFMYLPQSLTEDKYLCILLTRFFCF